MNPPEFCISLFSDSELLQKAVLYLIQNVWLLPGIHQLITQALTFKAKARMGVEEKDPGILALRTEKTRRFRVWNSVLGFLVFPLLASALAKRKEGMHNCYSIPKSWGLMDFCLMLIVEELHIYSREHRQVWGRVDSRWEDGWTAVCWGGQDVKGRKANPQSQTRSWNWKWNLGQFLKGDPCRNKVCHEGNLPTHSEQWGKACSCIGKLHTNMVPVMGTLRLNVLYPHKSQAPSLLNWLLSLLLRQNTWQKATFGRKGLFWPLMESEVSPFRQGRPDSRSRRQRLWHSHSREKRRGLLVFCSFLSPPVSARILASAKCSVPMGCVSTSVNSPCKHPHRRARRCNVWVVLNLAKLARKEASYHSIPSCLALPWKQPRYEQATDCQASAWWSMEQGKLFTQGELDWAGTICWVSNEDQTLLRG